MILDAAHALELARRAVELTEADEAEALVTVDSSALTRFANNRIHQNVAEHDTSVSVRAVHGTRVGVASTNRLAEDALRECCEAAARAALVSPEDESFPGLPGPGPVDTPERTCDGTREFGPEERAYAVAGIIEPSTARGLVAAGTVSASDQVFAVANSKGVSVAMGLTSSRATVLSMGEGGGSGWASFVGPDASLLPAAQLGEEAASLAERSAAPGDLEPGTYTVVLGPEAVANLVDFMSYVGFSAKSVEEGRSFMSGRLGEQVVSEQVTIVDDAYAGHAIGLTFDFEGCPKRRTELIVDGVAVGPVTDSYWAAATGRPNTGHALPAPNSYGPMPLDIAMSAGDIDAAELIASVKRGVYVTRFHYVNVEDPISVLLTGMTRDGTFMIEDGRLTRPLRNLRFTQSAIEALGSVRGISRERRFVGGDVLGAGLFPSVLVEKFAFTGQTT